MTRHKKNKATVRPLPFLPPLFITRNNQPPQYYNQAPPTHLPPCPSLYPPTEVKNYITAVRIEKSFRWRSAYRPSS